MIVETENYSITMNLDEIDFKLLQLLQEDSSRTVKELAALVNLSTTPVFERIKRIEASGIIKKYTAILDAEKLNQGFIVFCNVRLKQHSKELGKQFMQAVMPLDEITECYNISGDYDFMLKIYVNSMSHYQDFVLNTFGELDCIGNLQSLFVMGEIKNSNSIPLIKYKV